MYMKERKKRNNMQQHPDLHKSIQSIIIKKARCTQQLCTHTHLSANRYAKFMSPSTSPNVCSFIPTTALAYLLFAALKKGKRAVVLLFGSIARALERRFCLLALFDHRLQHIWRITSHSFAKEKLLLPLRSICLNLLKFKTSCLMSGKEKVIYNFLWQITSMVVEPFWVAI